MKKKVLIIGYDFHGYIHELKSAIDDDYECEVVIHKQIFDYVAEPVSRISYIIYRILFMQPLNFISKHSYSIFTFCFSKSFSTFFLSSLKLLKKNRYDVVIFVGSREFTPALIREVKKSIDSDRWVLYKWDSESRFSLKYLHSSFDSVFSFQRKDCIEPDVSYLPNFHNIKYNARTIEKEYLVSAVCLYSKERYELFMNYLTENKIDRRKVKAHFYSIKGEKGDFIYSYKLNHEEVVDMYKVSQSVFDFSQPSQPGMSQRVLEAMASGAIVITNNQDALANFSKCGLVQKYSTPFSDVLTNTPVDDENKLVALCFGPNWINKIIEN
ncbi:MULTISPECIES: hypothetical protein [unclassified Vibrio]|uniref:hypothetical protein n=1 Tax=unclassified Vibrio TaxID=2614977 RepID=UPI000CBCB0A9|nr:MULTISPECIES: hypothetical protein [unclassified Vibrio]PMK18707.1 hypothetical protein BCU05_17350 [Vibrio sp. 10N.261.54.C3]TKF38448.1 hypothetical protein FCV57_15160 [Vibrio sp. F13]